MATVRPIFFLFALLLALSALSACGGESAPAATSTPPPAAASSAPAQPAAASLPGDPKAAVLQALRAQLTAGPYRTTTTITVDGDDQTAVATLIPPDRMHLIMDLGGMKTEMIYIGDKVWSRQGDAAWVESDNMGTPGGALLDEAMIADTEQTITAAALAGQEQVDGVAALLYTFTTDLSRSTVMPMEGVADTKLWVDAATGRIIRQESTTTAAGTTSTTVQVVEYDPAITIEPPIQ